MSIKKNHSGQAKILSEIELKKIRENLRNPKHILFFDILKYTGERIGAIRQLKVQNVYSSLSPISIRESILFPSRIRKKGAGKISRSREVPIHPSLMESLLIFSPSIDQDFLFPGNLDQPISYRGIWKSFESAIAKAGLSFKGIKSHSFRRSFITKLSQQGVEIRLIQKITGHERLDSLMPYIDCDPARIKKAIALL